jgi:hypothetical protein
MEMTTDFLVFKKKGEDSVLRNIQLCPKPMDTDLE